MNTLTVEIKSKNFLTPSVESENIFPKNTKSADKCW